ncbi:MAG TPA: NAD(P)H-hydrate dehydratase [Terriglobales bacterium]|nr:NAD(P)H-hydrate dehydratase [Terriglobales bacterium]
MILVSRAEMRELDRLTIERYGTPGYTLMKRAAEGATDMLLQVFPHVRGRKVVILAGKGNNGGDGMIVARLLRRHRVKAEVVLLARRDEVAGDAAQAMRAYVAARGTLIEASGPNAVAEVAARIEGAALLVDALFGTGLNAPLAGTFQNVVELANASGIPVFAIDIPSGLDADRGVALGTAIQAEATATFGFAKIGQVIFPAARSVGVLGVVDIGIAPAAVDEVRPRARWLDADAARALMPHRAPDTHKGGTGHVLVIAGSRGHSGAALMCAHAACRGGAGLTTLAGPASLNTVFSLGRPEVMTATLPDRDGRITFDAKSLRAMLAGKDAVCIGPGLGTHAAAKKTVELILRESNVPVLLDADALTIVSASLRLLRYARGPMVLTPHPGEMARLLGVSAAEVQLDRVTHARQFAEEHGCVLVLKGARTVIAAPDGQVTINASGNPGMATGGMGDALSGLIAALLAQGLSTGDAAALGVYLHGAVADHLASGRGPIGLLASDVIEGIPAGFARLVSLASDDEPPFRQ